MTNILHVPGNIAILKHSYSDDLQPAVTSLRPPITPDALLSDPNEWRAFDTLNLHTVELTSIDALRRMIQTARDNDKRVLFTMHELEPNIESDQESFDFKARYVASSADKVIALTSACAELCQAKYGIPEEDIVVIPHGQPFVESAIAEYTAEASTNSIAAYGALRTYRSYTNLLSAWLTQDPAQRPDLQLCLRSVNPTEEKRYDRVLAELRALEGEKGYSLELHDGFLPDKELVDWLKQSDTLALPYTAITHSGQLETGLDLGMTVIAPDVITLRSQIDQHPRKSLAHFVSKTTVANPQAYGEHLLWKPEISDDTDLSGGAVEAYRAQELRGIKSRYADVARKE